VLAVATGLAVVAAYVAPLDATVCVAPTGTWLAPKLHTSVACLLSVTIDPVSGPALVASTVAAPGNAYIADAATVAVAFVRVETNVNTNEWLAAPAVTVAPRALLATSVESSTTVAVAGGASETSAAVEDPAENAPRFASIVGFVCANTNLVPVASESTSAYGPDAIVAMVTVSGTAYTVCPLVAMTFVAPDGAVTVTRNSSAPVVVPSVIAVTSIVFVSLS
jgi:hypothetical protein